eukprot:TRINITY_DN1243_c0_g1_i2.p1 TRINITY_DN1243_c0_g1~~TRINITY_DN1243_c0_g1_i2.p1  ORF type:complete len:416 (-),score=72.96 TRINITY_DN1243_c0_g1_i2:565-1812(-)
MFAQIWRLYVQAHADALRLGIKEVVLVIRQRIEVIALIREFIAAYHVLSRFRFWGQCFRNLLLKWNTLSEWTTSESCQFLWCLRHEYTILALLFTLEYACERFDFQEASVLNLRLKLLIESLMSKSSHNMFHSWLCRFHSVLKDKTAFLFSNITKCTPRSSCWDSCDKFLNQSHGDVIFCIRDLSEAENVGDGMEGRYPILFQMPADAPISLLHRVNAVSLIIDLTEKARRKWSDLVEDSSFTRRHSRASVPGVSSHDRDGSSGDDGSMGIGPPTFVHMHTETSVHGSEEGDEDTKSQADGASCDGVISGLEGNVSEDTHYISSLSSIPNYPIFMRVTRLKTYCVESSYHVLFRDEKAGATYLVFRAARDFFVIAVMMGKLKSSIRKDIVDFLNSIVKIGHLNEVKLFMSTPSKK